MAENRYALAELDERQYEHGALLVVPKKHRESLLDIDPAEIEGVFGATQHAHRH